MKRKIRPLRILNKSNRNHINKSTLSEIIFARACCSIGIIIFHYFCHSNGKFKLLSKTANSEWGYMFVTSFYSISGTVLYYNYPKVESIKAFYFKRWKSIFPSYYVCFFYFFLKNVFFFRKVFYKEHWSRLFLTLLGIDGYFKYRIKSYSIIGEWFLGSIILIYLLYPFLSCLMNVNLLLLNFMLCFGYIIMYKTKFFIISKNDNLICGINSFYFGMIVIKGKDLFFKKQFFFISIILFIYFYYFKLFQFVLIRQIQGFCLYISLIHIGKYAMKTKLKIIFTEISKLSYNIFLFQHIIILDILGVRNPVEWHIHIILLLITILLTIICARVLYIVVKDITESIIFKKIESFFLKTNKHKKILKILNKKKIKL